ncbi:hypothetical protein PACTADRAFT_50221 [Pachysolen tannophilus NRRL Y-2460]|uniref:Uncharacterized protein n=1 Tax=Pachysolen tannophilus NRRL Y-2460 TaxID=669874 RepID=A0A1E4TUU7_PACTA|nr:hypothetical protein PACTADRAFT_50221 [Pachysolen tannophilus NRRL Y-2460]
MNELIETDELLEERISNILRPVVIEKLTTVDNAEYRITAGDRLYLHNLIVNRLQINAKEFQVSQITDKIIADIEAEYDNILKNIGLGEKEKPELTLKAFCDISHGGNSSQQFKPSSF